MIQLNEKNIFVSGASSGIGRAIAIMASELGARVFITGRNAAKLKETEKCLKGNDHKAWVCDLTDEKNLLSLADKITSLDGIVHCAGIAKPMPAKFINKQHIDELFSTNFNAQVLLNARLLSKNKIKKSASVVFISSVSTNVPYFGGAMYMSTKAATNAYCKALAFELASQKIRVNCISPALVKTGIYEDMKAAVTAENLHAYEKKYPLGIGEPADIAAMAMFLISDSSKWITGTNIIMDGGLLLNTKQTI